MKKASIELSVNFIVVMIISVVLLGIGIKLMADFVNKAHNMEIKVSEYNKEQMRKLLYDGSLVSSYPSSVTLNRGEYTDFGIGIYNQLGSDQTFSISIDRVDISSGDNPTLDYRRGRPIPIKNNELYTDIGIRITAPKNSPPKTTYIYNVYVCNSTSCGKEFPYRYGDLQKLYINVN
jgi:hypothetical protein